MICHRWLIVLAVALACRSSRCLIHPKSTSNLYSSSDNNRSNNNDGTANSRSLTSDTQAEALALHSGTADNAIQQPDQRWIKPSPKALRLGDKCSQTEDCSLVTHSHCDTEKGGVCACTPQHPVEGGTLCTQGRQLNESCSFNAQCIDSDRNMECHDHVCQCAYDFKPTFYIGGNIVCTSTSVSDEMGTYINPTMIGALSGLILMFIIMCVVLRLFSKARWRENRTIFNTPNPRLANASLLKEVTSKQQVTGSRRSSLAKSGSRQSSLISIPHAHLDAPGTSRRPSLTRYGPNVTTATIATSTNDGGSSSAFAQPSEKEKLLDQNQICVQVDEQAISSV
ncbi:uncharacterized protein LOC130696185 [Daphnia carinata]|uniref:uncharacterized protein LOC130696185 n=1 Tax=Daphnia carinata TaxID=120202 RepID=UPI00257F3FA4|nr:uncharacterized protein LOC130696185 [Daphnia carinata]